MKRLIASILTVGLFVLPAYAATAQEEVTPADIAAADAKRRQVSVELSEITAQYDGAVQQTVETTEQLRVLGVEMSVAERTLAGLRIEAAEVARTLYMEAGSGGVSMLDAASINEIPVRTGYLERLSASGEATLSRLLAVQAAFDDQQGRLDVLLSEQEAEAAELEALSAEILDRLAAADAEYQAVVAKWEAQEEARRRAEEEARRRAEEEAARQAEEEARQATSTTAADNGQDATTTTAATDDSTTTTTAPPPPPPPPSGGRVCPVDGAVSFTDTWGAPRSGGRTHQGVDMIAARGTPLVAIESGTISWMSNSSLGGITLWIAGSSGDSFYYAHLDGYAAGVFAGMSVSAGQLVGYVGNTGNAQYTVPHLHFEHHPGGGAAINPYPLVAGLCF